MINGLANRFLYRKLSLGPSRWSASPGTRRLKLLGFVVAMASVVLTQGNVVLVKRCDDGEFFNSSSSSRESSPNEVRLPLQVRLDPCDQQPCLISRGTRAKLEIDFAADKDYQQIFAEVTAIILGSRVKLPVTRKNLCQGNFGIECPLKKSTNYTFSYNFFVPSMAPKLKPTQFRWKFLTSQKQGADKRLKDQRDGKQPLVCFLMTLEIA